MDFKDYYATLGVPASASHDEIKRAYRKLARKYHPDVSREPDAETRFKEVAEAHEALIDAERRAAYDDLAQRHAGGQAMGGGDAWADDGGAGGFGGYEFSGRGTGGADMPGTDAGFSAFFESLFGRAGRNAGRSTRGRAQAGPGSAFEPGGSGESRNPFGGHDDFTADSGPRRGADHHARMAIALEDTYRGATHTLSLRRPVVDAGGHAVLTEHQIEVKVPRGLRAGQQLRLAGQGGEGVNGGPPGDLFIEIAWRPHPRFRVDGRDVTVDLPLAPWEAALGAEVALAGPDRTVTLTVPPGATAGSRLRLKGVGLPGAPPGDLYALLSVALPRADTDLARAAYAALAAAFPAYNPREPQ